MKEIASNLSSDIIEAKETLNKFLEEKKCKLGEVKDYLNSIKFDKPVENEEEGKKILRIWKLRDLMNEGVIKESGNFVNKEKEIMKLEEVKRILWEVYDDIIKILKEYCDLKEDYYPLIAIWIIGTYVYESFNTYPYLFINAMRGSGKTRLLKLIKCLSYNGDLVSSIKEAVLFRTARGKTLCIDEFEGIHRKENAPLRELLNACYKKGIKIQRMRKKKTPEGDEQVVEEFEPYTPIAMANIYGMEEVLGDRCISLILEKSSDNMKTKLMEDFEENLIVRTIKSKMELIGVVWCSYFGVGRYINKWNSYIKFKYYNTTHTTHTTHNTPISKGEGSKNDEKWCSYGVVSPFLPLKESELTKIFDKIDATEINGRDLELIFPLLIIANFFNEKMFDNLLEICKKITKGKKDEEMIESKDVSLMDFVSQQINSGFISIKKMTVDFRNFIGDDDIDEKWVNSKWIGRSLKRLDLIVDKRRMRDGIHITLNIPKAIKKIELFRGLK